MDCYCDFDPPSVFRSAKHKARKTYRCYECRHPIVPGDLYEYSWGIWDGEPSEHHICSDCLELREFVKVNIPCFCWTYGGLKDSIREAIEYAYETARDEVRGFAFSVGRLVIKQRRRRLANASYDMPNRPFE